MQNKRQATIKIVINLKPDPKHAVFIINPVSGLGDAKTRFQIIKLAKEYGWIGKSYETTIKLSAGDIAKREIKKGAKHLVVCGGDGTIMSVLQAVIKRNVIVGIVPLGTGNLLAQNLKVSLNLKKAINTALHGRVHKIDLGLANGVFFAIIAGIGLDAELMLNTDRKAKNKLGFMAYVIGGFKTLGHSSGLYNISIDGKKAKIYKAKSIMIANMGRLLGGFEAVPNTRSDNGILRIGIMQASGLLTWIDLTINILKGNINKSRHYKLLTGKNVSIISLKGKKSFQCDGETFPVTDKLDVEIYPQTLPIMIESIK